MSFVEKLRDQLPNVCVQANCGGGSFKSQIKKADKSGAKVALILGDDEIEKHSVSVKMLREKTQQQNVAQADLIATLKPIL